MIKKNIKIMLILSTLLISLSACSKEKQNNSVSINLPIQDEVNENLSETETTVNSESISNNESTEDLENSSSVTIPEDKKDSEFVTYKKLLTEKKALDEFLNQLKYMQEKYLLETYQKWELGANITDIVEDLNLLKLRYINNVTLDFLYDESGSLINMKKRTGLIVFSSSNLKSEEESKRFSSIETYKEANNKDIIIDSTGCDFDSFIVYTFNEEGVLIGKFKYLLTQDKGKSLDINKINGSLTFNEEVPLQIDETSEIIDVYEKIDTTKTLIEEYKTNINGLYSICYQEFKKVYDSLTENNSSNELAKMVKEADLGIEQMPMSALEPYNKKYLKEYNTGYYIYMSINEDKNSPDLRYDGEYLTVIFDNSDKMYYAEIISKSYNDIKCSDEKNADDYSLKELNKLIASYESTLEKYKTEKAQFYDYFEKNLGLLNSKISFDMTKTAIVSEIEESNLTYETNYSSSALTTAKDSTGASISLVDAYGEKLYDDCIKVTSYVRSVFYFFKDDILMGIYKSDYIDISEGNSIEDYYSLNTIRKGLEQLIDKESSTKEECQIYINMVNKKLSDFMKIIGFSSNHTESQIYKKADIIKALDSNGFKYEEGMNKADGLYYIGIFALDSDTKYAYKLYFNNKLEVELIQ